MSSTRDRIIEAAASAVSSGEASSLEEIASGAGVSRATIYRYFGSRDGLLEAVAATGVDVGLAETTDIKQRILLGARAVYGRVGLERATIEQIAREAGVGEATIYRHFGTHENLARAFIGFARDLRPRLLALDDDQDIEQALSHFATRTIKICIENRDVLRLVFAGDSVELAAQFRRGPNRTVTLLRDYFANQIERGVLDDVYSPHELALSFAFMMMGYGVFAPMLEGEEPRPPEELGSMVARIFVDGMRQKTDE